METDLKALTPMMKQYLELKKQYSEEILFFRLGDFYEMFADDALIGSEILGIALTARAKGENRIPMCGVPYHAAANYIAKLTRAGKKVAICEQLSDPTLPGIVKRDVIRVITPGTTIDENILDSKTANFIGALVHEAGGEGESGATMFSLAYCDLSTGDFKLIESGSQTETFDIIEKMQIKELVITAAFEQTGLAAILKKRFSKIYFSILKENEIPDRSPGRRFASIQDDSAPDLLMHYLKRTQKTALVHLNEIEKIENDSVMHLDESTIRNLEILDPAFAKSSAGKDKKIEGSLLGVLDQTVTSGGGRLLKQIIVQPLLDAGKIQRRLDLIEFFLKSSGGQSLILDLRLLLKEISDLERIIGRLSLNSGNGRDLKMLGRALNKIKEVKALIINREEETLKSFANQLNPLEKFAAKLENAVVDEPPVSVKEGGLIKEGFDAELDSYKAISKSGKDYILALQAREVERTKINSLKVKYNRIFGYYIEISNANLAQVPADYTRKQTLANAERFSTPELKEYEEKILNAEERIFVIELQIFEKLRAEVLGLITELKANARAVAWLDVMSSLALVAWENKYVRPEIVGESADALEIIGGRHPVIEKLNPYDRFVPNDLNLNESERLMLITGPNMGGKSTFLRQNALIVLMAQLGSFVPADRAVISLVDRIFTRVGASDNLVKGQSTFWVEMEETALILNNATEKSLLILDEIGRGTSTYDGVSIAWAIVEYIHNHLKAKTLFATHYHELIKLAEDLPQSTNFSVLIKENEGIVFLYKIARGGVDRSYGIEVARLAGLPASVVTRAKEILRNLEKTPSSPHPGPDLGSSYSVLKQVQEEGAERKHSGLEKNIREIDLNSLTPLDLVNKIAEIQKEFT